MSAVLQPKADTSGAAEPPDRVVLVAAASSEPPAPTCPQTGASCARQPACALPGVAARTGCHAWVEAEREAGRRRQEADQRRDLYEKQTNRGEQP